MRFRKPTKEYFYRIDYICPIEYFVSPDQPDIARGAPRGSIGASWLFGSIRDARRWCGIYRVVYRCNFRVHKLPARQTIGGEWG